MRHPATSRLYHKDERQRRRAVRKLFEVNDPENLYDFINLLDDKEAWYREKSMEAIVKWANNGDEKIIQKLSSSKHISQRLLAAKLSPRLDKNRNKILQMLCLDDEITVRISAWEEKFNVPDSEINNLIKNGMASKDKAIRKISLIRLSKMDNIEIKYILESLEDVSYSVINAGLEIIKSEPQINKDGDFDGHLTRIAFDKSNKNCNIAASILIEKNYTNVEMNKYILKWSEESDMEFLNPIVNSLRKIEWWNNEKLRLHIINNSSDAFVIKIIRGSNSEMVTKIRNEILTKSERDDDVKSRIIEDLIGRKISNSTLEIIKEIKNNSNPTLSIVSKDLLDNL